MRAVIQRVSRASLTIDDRLYSSIDEGLLVLLGIHENDTAEDVSWLVSKIAQMRIFSDAEGKMNLSAHDINGSIMVVSQFTLHASTRKGNRPSFIEAARPEVAIPLYESFIKEISVLFPNKTATGSFGADMKIDLTNDGPVTIIIDSKQKV
jgi:D-tyrosyl-tRNA(Tyr) deacylase